MQWETVIGLEVHVQLATKSKIFSGASTQFGAEPNTQACAVDLGLPGVLPVLNKEVVRLAIIFGLSIEADINQHAVFARKHYFYPDLPKGYQISQHNHPIVGKGQLPIVLEDGTQKVINVTRAHLEEDAGKSLHEAFQGMTGIDLNRAGTPLLEIVSEPELRSAKEAIAYLKRLHSLVRYLGISDANMQEGSFRCDANVSVRPKNQETFGTRTEIKNLNSFRFIEKAILYEADRQIDLLESGKTVTQETRLYDPDANQTRPMRTKEEAHDYRYFPDPDLLPLNIDEQFILDIKTKQPELPWEKQTRFCQQYNLSEDDSQQLTSSRALADYYEACIHAQKIGTKLAANWINGTLTAALNKHYFTIEDSPITAGQLSKLLSRIEDNSISANMAKEVFEAMWQGEHDADADNIIAAKGIKQITDTSAIETLIDDVLASNPAQVAEFRAGKEKMLSFFVGQIMKASRGQANPQQVNQLLKKKLK